MPKIGPQDDMVDTELLRLVEELLKRQSFALDEKRCREIMGLQKKLVDMDYIQDFNRRWQGALDLDGMDGIPRNLEIESEHPDWSRYDSVEDELRVEVARWIINQVAPAAWKHNIPIPIASEVIEIADKYRGREYNGQKFQGWDIPEMPDHLKVEWQRIVNPRRVNPQSSKNPPPGGWRRRESDRRDDEQNRGSGGASVS